MNIDTVVTAARQRSISIPPVVIYSRRHGGASVKKRALVSTPLLLFRDLHESYSACGRALRHAECRRTSSVSFSFYADYKVEHGASMEHGIILQTSQKSNLHFLSRYKTPLLPSCDFYSRRALSTT